MRLCWNPQGGLKLMAIFATFNVDGAGKIGVRHGATHTWLEAIETEGGSRRG